MRNKIDITIIQNDFNSDNTPVFENLYNYILNNKFKKNSIVILHELSLTKYFPISKKAKNKNLSININSNEINRLKNICKKINIYLIVSFYENTSNSKKYNSAIVISPDGKILGKQRKLNLPNESCYHENYYFEKNHHIKAIDIGICKIGILICWDQWFFDNYRKLNNKGVDIIFSPTSIGVATSKSRLCTLKNEKKNWEMIIRSNSLMINTPIIVANRCSQENDTTNSIKFWGSSFATNSDGEIIAKAKTRNQILHFSVDLRKKRESVKKWGFIESI